MSKFADPRFWVDTLDRAIAIGGTELRRDASEAKTSSETNAASSMTRTSAVLPALVSVLCGTARM